MEDSRGTVEDGRRTMETSRQAMETVPWQGDRPPFQHPEFSRYVEIGPNLWWPAGGLGRRVMARVIDTVVLVLVAAVLSAVSTLYSLIAIPVVIAAASSGVMVLAELIWLTLILGLLGAAMLLPLALTGFTPGKRLMGLRVAPVHDANGPDSRLGVLTVLRRSALPAAAAVMFIGGDLVVPTQVAGAVGLGLVLFHVLGQLALFFDAPVYRTWHDRLAHTVVVEWRPEWAPPLGRASGSPVD